MDLVNVQEPFYDGSITRMYFLIAKVKAILAMIQSGYHMRDITRFMCIVNYLASGCPIWVEFSKESRHEVLNELACVEVFL